MSYANYVTTRGDNGKFHTNGIRFATAKEAETYGNDLSGRWHAIIKYEVRETVAPANYTWNFETSKLEPAEVTI